MALAAEFNVALLISAKDRITIFLLNVKVTSPVGVMLLNFTSGEKENFRVLLISLL